MRLSDPKVDVVKTYQFQFRFDRDTRDHLDSLSKMFPYEAPKSVIVRELINSAYEEAVKEGLINE